MPEAAEELTRRWFDEVWNHKRTGAIDELFAPEGVAHGLGSDGGDVRGIDAFKQFHTTLIGAFPDMHVAIEDVVASGDRAAWRGTVTGTHRGDHLGMPATGRQVEIPAMGFCRVRGNRIVEGWNLVDFAGMNRQIAGE